MAQELDEQKAAQQSLAESESYITSLCSQNADLMVSVQRRSEHVLRALQDLVVTVDDAVETSDDASSSSSLMHMAMELERQGETLNKLANKHKMRRQTLLQHSSLLELLEIPSLMDACVRCKMYDECLSLASLANSLERSHSLGNDDGIKEGTHNSSRIDVVQSVVSDVRHREDDLRRHLLSRLRGGGNTAAEQAHLSLPQCLEVVTALRRLNSIKLERKQNSSKTSVLSRDEVERSHSLMELRLQIDFFEARDSWLESALIKPSLISEYNISDPNAKIVPTEPLLDLIEVYRTRCFEIASQYFAIFQSSKSTVNGNESNDISLLSLWIARRLEIFISKLEEGLMSVNDTGSLRDILDATVFFASSMGRLGADFQPLLPPLFESKVVEIVTGHWTKGLQSLSNSLQACKDAGIASPLFNNTVNFDESSKTETPDEGSLTVPRRLLSLPPLSRLTNSYLTGLNELRRCLLPGVFSSLKQKVDDFLKDIDSILQANQKSVMTPGLRGDARTLREMSAKYRDEFEKTVKPFFLVAIDYALGYDIDFAKVSFVERKEGSSDETNEAEEKNGNQSEAIPVQEPSTNVNADIIVQGEGIDGDEGLDSLSNNVTEDA